MVNRIIQNPKLTAKNPHFGNTYAPLDEVFRVILDVVPEGNLVQTVEPIDGVPYFVSKMIAASGAVERQVQFPFAAGKGDPQSLGSALTYARRYGLLLLFNLVGEEDDDANAAQPKPAAKKASKPKAKAAPKANKIDTDAWGDTPAQSEAANTEAGDW